MFDEILVNSGPLFTPAKLTDLVNGPAWDCDEAAQRAKLAVQETMDKHADLLKGDILEPQTKFFIVNPVLHQLGYVYSIDEAVPIGHDTRAQVHYTLFPDMDHFTEVEPLRGSPAFFRNAATLAQAAEWGESLDLSEDAEAAAQQPAVLIDLFLRKSGINYGIVTNGGKWRLVHRATSDKFNVFVEIDLTKVLAGNLDDFKAFFVLFGSAALAVNNDGLCLLDNLLE